MNVNLQIIQEELADYHFKGIFNSPPYIMNSSYFLILTATLEEPSKDVIYITSPEIFQDCCRNRAVSGAEGNTGEAFSFILTDNLDVNESDQVNLLIPPGPIEIVELQNRLQLIFHKYHQWEEDVQAMIAENQSFDMIARSSLPFCPNPVMYQGPQFRSIYHVLPEESEKHKNAPEWDRFHEYLQIYADPEEASSNYNVLSSDPEFAAHIEDPLPYLYSGKSYGFRSLWSNVFVDRKVAARIYINEIIQPFTDKDTAILTILTNHMKTYIRSKRLSALSRPRDIDDIMRALLGHRFIPETRISRTLSKYNWQIHDTYLSFCMKPHSGSDNEELLYSLASGFSLFMRSDCSCVINSHIIYIVNLTQNAMDWRSFLQMTLPHLRDNLILAGISDPFNDFKKLYYYSQQAQAALDLGSKREETRWYYHFADYRLTYCLQKMSAGMPADTLIPPGLTALVSYDKTHNTSYAETLRIYLECERSVADTVRKLYIHRNSFTYRLERIQKISGFNLDDPETRLMIMMSFAIL